MRGDWRLRVILGATVLLLCPWPLVVAPALDLAVVDERGEPVPFIAARQSWYDATGMADQLERLRLTDEQGRVSFPRRVTWASTAGRILRFGRVLGRHHFTLRRSAVFVWDVGYKTGYADYRPGEPLPTRIVMKPDPCPPRPIAGRAARLRQSREPNQSNRGPSQCIPG